MMTSVVQRFVARQKHQHTDTANQSAHKQCWWGNTRQQHQPAVQSDSQTHWMLTSAQINKQHWLLKEHTFVAECFFVTRIFVWQETTW